MNAAHCSGYRCSDLVDTMPLIAFVLKRAILFVCLNDYCMHASFFLFSFFDDYFWGGGCHFFFFGGVFFFIYFF